MSVLSDVGGSVLPGVGAPIALVENFIGKIGGHKHERFSDPDKLAMYVSFRDSFIVPYLKNTYGLDIFSTEVAMWNNMELSCWKLYQGAIDNVQFHRPQSETGAAINDANKLVGYKGTGAYVNAEQSFRRAWFWMTWDMWKQDPSDLIYNQRWVPMLKVLDAWVLALNVKPITPPSPSNIKGPNVDGGVISIEQAAAASGGKVQTGAPSSTAVSVGTSSPGTAGVSGDNSTVLIIVGLALAGALAAMFFGKQS